MRIVVAGAGAMGCRYGYRLAEAGHHVSLLDGWPAHIKAIREHGLRVTDEDGERTVPMRAHEFAEVPELAKTARPDLVIIFGKATQTQSIVDICRAIFAEDTLVCTLQNGIGNIEAIERYVFANRILPGTTTFGTELTGPGAIRALGSGQTHLTALEDDGTGRAKQVVSAMSESGLHAELSPTVLTTIWTKVAFNCVLNPVGALLRSMVGKFPAYAGWDTLQRSILDEVDAVAAAEGVDLPRANVEELIASGIENAADHFTSMQQDLESGRCTEVDHLNGAIAERAERHGIAAPVNATIAHLIRLAETTR